MPIGTPSLKTQNKIALWMIVAANLAVYLAVVERQSILTGDWAASAQSIALIPAGLIIVGVLNVLLTADCKSSIIFCRRKNPLPGSEAFTRYAHLDQRIDVPELSRRVGPFPVDPVEQNRLWYKLYRQIASDPSVSQVHREYLFTRDYACLALMMFVVLGMAGAFQIRPWWVALLYTTIPLIQYFFAAIAARNHGRRLVQTVLAITCTQEKGSDK